MTNHIFKCKFSYLCSAVMKANQGKAMSEESKETWDEWAEERRLLVRKVARKLTKINFPKPKPKPKPCITL